MTYNPDRHHRRSIRLRGYDYSRAGAYFVTICTRTRECLFGEIRNGQMHPNDLGRIVADSWNWLADQYPHVALDAYVVMPNHLHGIIVLIDDPAPPAAGAADARTGGAGTVGAGTGGSRGTGGSPRTGGSRTAPTEADPAHPSAPPTPKRKPLGRLVGAFKTVSAKRIGELTDIPGTAVWHRDFYDHVIRDDRSLARIREYIATNPARWVEDTLHPDHPNPFPPPPPRTAGR